MAGSVTFTLGGLQGLGVCRAGRIHSCPSTGAFDALAKLDFGLMGVIIVGAFVVTWVGAYAIFKIRRVEEHWGRMVRS